MLHEGQITPAEFERLGRLGRSDTGELGVNILIGFGVTGVAGGAVALLPDPRTGVVLGALAMAAGIAVLCLDAILGSDAGYTHAEYSIGIEQPALTVIVFAVLALGFYLASKRLPPAYERLSIVAARVSVFLVNLGFWIGSLWGDDLGGLATGAEIVKIPAVAFAAVWAVALLGAGAWAVHANRRWVLNLVAVFAGIDFYTQWFERLGATPISVFGGGLLVLVFALALWRWNQRVRVERDRGVCAVEDAERRFPLQ